MIVITVMNREFVKVFQRKFAGAATANPGVHFECAFPVTALPFLLTSPRICHDLFHSCGRRTALLFSCRHDGTFFQMTSAVTVGRLSGALPGQGNPSPDTVRMNSGYFKDRCAALPVRGAENAGPGKSSAVLIIDHTLKSDAEFDARVALDDIHNRMHRQRQSVNQSESDTGTHGVSRQFIFQTVE